MNNANFQILADTIRANPEHFRLSSWFYNGSDTISTSELPRGEELNVCGTAACLCGWTNYITENTTLDIFAEKVLVDWSNCEHAAEWLGISEYQSEHLFTPTIDLNDNYIMFWTEAYEEGITTNTCPYKTPPSEVADMLEAFAKGELKLL